jgi:hypothetical protein
MNNSQGLPQEAVENILSNLIYTDALTLPDKDVITAFINTCPIEWQQYFMDKYVSKLKDNSKLFVSTREALSYLIPNNGKVLQQMKYVSTKNNKKSNRVCNVYLVKMCKWLLVEYGDTRNWKANQIYENMTQKYKKKWTPSILLEIFPKLIDHLCQKLDFDKDLLKEIYNCTDFIDLLRDNCHKEDIKEVLFDFFVKNKYDGDCDALQLRICFGEKDAIKKIWNKKCDKLLDNYIEKPDNLKNMIYEVGCKINWNITGLNELYSICNNNDFMISINNHVNVIKYIMSHIDRKAFIDILSKDKLEAFEKICRYNLDTIGISIAEEKEAIEAIEDKIVDSWKLDNYYDYNDYNGYVDTIHRYFELKNSLNSKNIIFENNEITKNGISLEEITSYDVIDIMKEEFEDDNIEWLVDYFGDAFDRYFELKEALESKGLEIRNDSKLCRSYIDEDDGDIEYIVKVMYEMDFFFKKTKYEDIVSKIRERDNHHDKSRYGVSLWAKKVALLKYKNEFGIPEFLINHEDFMDDNDLKAANDEYNNLLKNDKCYGRCLCCSCMDGYSYDSDDSDCSYNSQYSRW